MSKCKAVLDSARITEIRVRTKESEPPVTANVGSTTPQSSAAAEPVPELRTGKE